MGDLLKISKENGPTRQRDLGFMYCDYHKIPITTGMLKRKKYKCVAHGRYCKYVKFDGGFYMRKDTGEIREYEKIPKKDLGDWSRPFRKGEVVDFKGVKMEIVRIKQVKKEIHLRFKGK